jgi:hypothetical protein
MRVSKLHSIEPIPPNFSARSFTTAGFLVFGWVFQHLTKALALPDLCHWSMVQT